VRTHRDGTETPISRIQVTWYLSREELAGALNAACAPDDKAGLRDLPSPRPQSAGNWRRTPVRSATGATSTSACPGWTQTRCSNGLYDRLTASPGNKSHVPGEDGSAFEAVCAAVANNRPHMPYMKPRAPREASPPAGR
jgi:hypothetical protein